MDPAPSLFRGIGRIQNSYDAFSGLKPLEHIRHRSFGGGASHFLAFGIMRVEEVRIGLWRACTTVAADVEYPSGDANPGKISHSWIN